MHADTYEDVPLPVEKILTDRLLDSVIALTERQLRDLTDKISTKHGVLTRLYDEKNQRKGL